MVDIHHYSPPLQASSGYCLLRLTGTYAMIFCVLLFNYDDVCAVIHSSYYHYHYHYHYHNHCHCIIAIVIAIVIVVPITVTITTIFIMAID